MYDLRCPGSIQFRTRLERKLRPMLSPTPLDLLRVLAYRLCDYFQSQQSQILSPGSSPED
jgi:hypothetical protein